MIRRVRCPGCDTEQEFTPGGCIVCGHALVRSPRAEELSDRGGAEGEGPEARPRGSEAPPPAPESSRGEASFEVEAGDLGAHAAGLPEAPPPSRFEDLEELRRSERRRETLLGLLPLSGPWRISRSELHSAGEKLLIGTLSVFLTVGLGVLAATFRPASLGRAAAVGARVEREIRELQRLVEEFRADKGRLPTQEEWDTSVSSADARFYDPWGRPYVYEPAEGGYRIGTYGEDGVPGGAAAAADRFVRSAERSELGSRPGVPVERPPEDLGGDAADHAVLATDGCPVVEIGSDSVVRVEGRLRLAARCPASEAMRLGERALFDVPGGVVVTSGAARDRSAVDPLASLPAPRFEGTTFFVPSSPSGLPHRHGSPRAPRTRVVDTAEVLSPGVYWGGLRVVSGGDARLEPGEYVLAGGGLLVAGNGSLTADGIVIYNTLDPMEPFDLGGYERIYFDETARVRLSAPPQGPYRGLLLFQDRANPYPLEIRAPLDEGAITGAIYAARAELRIGGRGGVLRSRLIAHRLAMQSSLNVFLAPQTLSLHPRDRG